MAENEIKFVIGGYDELETLLTPFGWHDIAQGYLTPNNRVRQITFENGAQQYYFGFKYRLPNGHNLEIEPAISKDNFAEAWEFTNERIKKRRIPIEHGKLRWDIDFYRWPRGRYFVLAEVEMPANMERPDTILPYLQKHLVYEVPREDDRFAARRLSDEDHVRTIARDLGLLAE